MDLKNYVSVTGHGGLFKIISRAKTGLIVESLVDKKRMPVYANQKVLSLDDISIFCIDADTPLKEVFAKMYEKTEGKETLDAKEIAPNLLADYMVEVLPTFDRVKVYTSDLKKIFIWFNLLLPTGSLAPSAEESTDEAKGGEVNTKAIAPKAKMVEKVAKTAKAAPKVAKSIGVRKTG